MFLGFWEWFVCGLLFIFLSYAKFIIIFFLSYGNCLYIWSQTVINSFSFNVSFSSLNSLKIGSNISLIFLGILLILTAEFLIILSSSPSNKENIFLNALSFLFSNNLSVDLFIIGSEK